MSVVHFIPDLHTRAHRSEASCGSRAKALKKRGK